MIVVCPVRFTDNLAEMRTFLELLGLSPRIESTHGTWVDLSAGEGMDLYGYVEHDQLGTASQRLAVVPVRFTDDTDGHHRFLTALGMFGEPAPGGYSTYSSGGGGFVGIHRIYGDDLPIVAGNGASVHLTLATEADPGELRERFETAGFPVTRFDEDFGSSLETIDPDGQSVQIHGWPG